MINDPVKATLLARVYDVAVKTPLQKAYKISEQCHNYVYLKREDTQPIHSFKIRGAYNKISRLSDQERSRGIIAASAGNHAQGVALSAKKLGIEATIVMPKTTPSIKVEAVKDLGAKVVLEGDNYSEAYDECQKIIASSGMTLIHPFDDPLVISGQGTVGKEILEQLPDVDYIFVPVGGGGLAAGIAQFTKLLRPDVKVIGVEPNDSSAMMRSLEADRRITLDHVGVFADGVAVKQVGALPFKLCKEYLDDTISVNNDQICAAIKNIFEETRGIVEPAGSLSLAGALSYIKDHQITDKNIVTICSGANITFEKLQFIAERTLLGSGKEALFDVSLSESPGSLQMFCQKVIKSHNITGFSYRLQDRTEAHVLVGISVSGVDDKEKFVQKMVDHKFKFQDLSDDDLAKEHVRHMIGGTAVQVHDEHIYELYIPERPRALSDFLDILGNHWNISLFHYRGQGGDIGKVLIGFETDGISEIEVLLSKSGYEFSVADSSAVNTFLK